MLFVGGYRPPKGWEKTDMKLKWLTAGEAFAGALANLNAKPIAAFAFNCAGRKGKLDNLEDELSAIQKEFGTQTPIFGTYCAGEIGPADISEKPQGVLSSGIGWHLMVTVLGR
jgi:small ligand-binding sensory domain FIST